MEAELLKHEQLMYYKHIRDNDFARNDLPANLSFKKQFAQIQVLKQMCDELLLIIDVNYARIPSEIFFKFVDFLSSFNTLLALVVDYSIEKDINAFNDNKALKNRLQTFYDSVFMLLHRDERIDCYFLDIYSIIKSFNNEEQSIKTYFTEGKEKIDDLKKQVEDLIHQLQKNAARESVKNYAQIFEDEAIKHSSFKKWKIGLSERWIIVAIVFVSVLVTTIFMIKSIVPIEKTATPTELSLTLVTRTLIISFEIFLVTFALKQYNIQKHLHTLNQHRKNTLDSYKLFIDSLDASDVTTKNALMMEVAKAIYDLGQTGYLPTKDSGDSSPSIVELTRFIGKPNS